MKTILILLVPFFARASARAALISLSFSGDLTQPQQAAFERAAGYWNSVITGYDLVYDGWGQETPHALEISVSVPVMDGVGGILGSAGPDTATYYDDNPLGQPTRALWYASTGGMAFDTADVDWMIGAGTFDAVVLHEMAHVLGFGTLWTYNTDLNKTDYDLYVAGSGQYTGPNALREWRVEFSQPAATYIPVETGGGGGTADGHWDEADGGGDLTGILDPGGLDLRNELMTGWAAEMFFVSRTTLGAIDDLGYVVDYSKAGVVPELSTASYLALAFAPVLALARRRRGRHVRRAAT
jgi:hypothetical protein